MTEFEDRYNLADEGTPKMEQLTPYYKRSFAHYTMRDRLPVILTQVIDQISQDKDKIISKFGEDSRDELKDVIGNISKLKYELQTDKQFTFLQADTPDKKMWNDFLLTLNDKNTYFSAVWLYSECYMYRKLQSFFDESKYFKKFDHFGYFKRKAFNSSKESYAYVADTVTEFTDNKESKSLEEKELFFRQLLKINLWGNRCDLSISKGKNVGQSGNPFCVLESLESQILADDTAAIWKCVSAGNADETVIEIINDNVGYELYTDLCVADFLIENGLAKCVIFNVKAVPWFISDVMTNDFIWTLDQLTEQSDIAVCHLGKKWKKYLETGQFVLHQLDYFWTTAYEFHKMKAVDSGLYNRLSSSHLLIFKGDLNYRKLLGDMNFEFSTPFSDALQGFRPTNLCALRTVKADLICGIKSGVDTELTKENPKWMETGEYGVIQFASKN